MSHTSLIKFSFALLLSTTAILTAQNVQFKEPPPQLNELKLSGVFVGDPGLLTQLKGRVVVLGSLSLSAVTPDTPPATPNRVLTQQEKAYYKNLNSAENKRRAKEQADKNMKTTKEFAKEFDRLAAKYKTSPDVRVAGVMGIDSDATPAKVLAHAKDVNFTLPILRREGSFDAWRGLTHAYVMVFNAGGSLCYNGKPGPEADKAVRDALKTMTP